jgi:uncharacterized protein
MTVADALWMALALVLVFEGLLPFSNPTLWRQVFEKALQMSDGQLRFLGLTSIVVGMLLLWFTT